MIRIIQQTSLLAYKEIRAKVGGKQAKVLEALTQLRVATDKELACFLQWPINCVTPRRNELVKMGQVFEGGKVMQEERLAILWTVKFFSVEVNNNDR